MNAYFLENNQVMARRYDGTIEEFWPASLGSSPAQLSALVQTQNLRARAVETGKHQPACNMTRFAPNDRENATKRYCTCQTFPRPRRQSRRALPIPFMPTAAGYGLTCFPTGRQNAPAAPLDIPTATGGTCPDCGLALDVFGVCDVCLQAEAAVAPLMAVCTSWYDMQDAHLAAGADVCTFCKIANVFGRPACFDEACPNPIR